MAASSDHQRQRQPPRKCIFCGEGGLSREHLWPQWMHPYLPKIRNPRKDEGYRAVQFKIRATISQSSIRQGHVYTKQFRVVCKKCNETWMNIIERDAKEILIPLLRGQPITLLRNKRRRLAKWITLKSMIVDAENLKDMAFTNAARVPFKENGEIPRKLRIWIAHHNDETWYSRLHYQSMRGVPSLTSGSNIQGKNIQTTTIGLNHLFVFAFYAAVPGVNLKMNIRGIFHRRTIQIWPLLHQSIVWPPPALLSSETDRLANIMLNEFAASSLEKEEPGPSLGS